MATASDEDDDSSPETVSSSVCLLQHEEIIPNIFIVY